MFDVSSFDVKKYEEILNKGLSRGLGIRDSQMCIEAAICTVLGLPHSDNPQCVSNSIKYFKIALNDKDWSSSMARAQGLRKLGLAQLGSKGVVSDDDFIKKLSEKIIKVLIPKLFRQVFPDNEKCLASAKRCEEEGTKDAVVEAAEIARCVAASAASSAAEAAYEAAGYAKCIDEKKKIKQNSVIGSDAAVDTAATADVYAKCAAYAAASYATKAAVVDVDADFYATYHAADAADLAANAAYEAYTATNGVNATYTAAAADEYLILVAELALEVLRELNSPGITLLNQ